jgi:hypothetical protein
MQSFGSQRLLRTSIALLAVLTLVGNSLGCALNPPVHYILPDGYFGMLKIVLDEKNGIEIPLKDGRYTYEIPDDGILKVKSFAPLRPMHDETAAYRSGKEIVLPSSQVPDDVVALRDVGQYSIGDGPFTVIFVLGTKAHQDQVAKDLSRDFYQMSPKIYNQRLRQE